MLLLFNKFPQIFLFFAILFKTATYGSTVFELSSSYCHKGVVFLADLEGQIEYTNRVFEQLADKGVLSAKYDIMHQYNNVALSPGWCIVFGGDIADRGNGSLRLISMAVSLKERYPERVLLISGNREYNKMRWLCEWSLRTDESRGKRFRPFPGANTSTRPSAVSKDLFEGFIGRKEEEDLEYISYLLQNTMGIGVKNQVERIGELTELLQTKPTINQYFDSFSIDISFHDSHHLEDKRMNTLLYRMSDYIRLSLPISALRNEQTGGRVIFVHGGISPSNFLTVDAHFTRKEKDIAAWIAAAKNSMDNVLNTLSIKDFDYRSEASCYHFYEKLQCGRHETLNKDITVLRPAYQLITDAALSDKQFTTENPSPYLNWIVVDAEHFAPVDGLDEKYIEITPLDLRKDMLSFMNEHHVDGIFVGHKPRGSSSIVTVAENGKFIAMADNSYGREEQGGNYDLLYFVPTGTGGMIVNEGKLPNGVLKGATYKITSADPLFGRSKIEDGKIYTMRGKVEVGGWGESQLLVSSFEVAGERAKHNYQLVDAWMTKENPSVKLRG